MSYFDSSLMQSEAVVNAGPAVFISQSAPNPIMVQVIFSMLYYSIYLLLQQLYHLFTIILPLSITSVF